MMESGMKVVENLNFYIVLLTRGDNNTASIINTRVSLFFVLISQAIIMKLHKRCQRHTEEYRIPFSQKECEPNRGRNLVCIIKICICLMLKINKNMNYLNYDTGMTQRGNY